MCIRDRSFEAPQPTDAGQTPAEESTSYMAEAETPAPEMPTPSPAKEDVYKRQPQGNIYLPGEAGLEALPPFAEVRDTLFAGMPIQVGYCNGNSSLLNGLEYHKSIEVIVAQSDLVLQLSLIHI